MKKSTLRALDPLLFNLHEVLVRDDEVILCVESFLFLGIKTVFLFIVLPFTESEDLFVLGENSSFAMQCKGSAKLNWVDLEEED